MRLRIHRGAREIGGSCVELEQDGLSLLIDLGLPLESEPTLPIVPGLLEPDDHLLGVVLSHPHLDHYGLLPLVRNDLPVWLGAGATRLLAAAAPFTAGSRITQKITPYRDRETFDVGPFRVTPYLMDHSAFDAYGLVVEAAGKRVFYSGDFRGHGRKAGTFERFLAKPPTNVDVILMEGTTLGRDADVTSEHDVEDRATAIMQATEGLVLTCFSGQNIDRFVSFYRASVRSGRTFVIDAYMANLIRGIGLPSLPDVASDEWLRVFLPSGQRRTLIAQQRFDLIDWVRDRRIYADELSAGTGQFAMMFRPTMARDMGKLDLGRASLIYSMWPGYLERDKIDLRQWCSERQIQFDIVHSSGHAHLADLQRMAEAVDAKWVVPIHSAHPDKYPGLFAQTSAIEDGVWGEI